MKNVQGSNRENPHRTFWAKPERWPKGDREHVFLAEAFNEAGAAMYGPQWSGGEALAKFDYSKSELRNISLPLQKFTVEAFRIAMPERPTPTQAKLDAGWGKLERERLARVAELQALIEPAARADAVTEWLSDCGRNGDIDTKARFLEGGEFVHATKGLWNNEKPWPRLLERGCQCLSDGRAAYLFLTRASLDRCLSEIPVAKPAAEEVAEKVAEVPTIDLLGAAPDRPRIDDPFMGMTEAIAWIGSRNWRFADAVRWHSLDQPDYDGYWGAAVSYALSEQLADQYGADASEARRHLFNGAAIGDLKARGRGGGSGYSEIDPEDWIDAKIIFENTPDVLVLAGPNNSLYAPRWTHVRFVRSEVLTIWPEFGSSVEAVDASTSPVELDRAARKGRGRRPGVGGFAKSDEKIAIEMRDMVISEQVKSPFAAAKQLAHKAEGSPEPGVREKRLTDVYYRLFPAE